MKPYKTYFHRGQDPMVDRVLTALNGYTFSEVSKLSGISSSTPRNWKRRKTMRPQHTTLAAALGAVGKEFAIVNKKR